MEQDDSSKEHGDYVSEVILTNELEPNQQWIDPPDEESDSDDGAAEQTLGWVSTSSESSPQTNIFVLLM
ncbi:hypothetical protein PI124_g18488 [Phytophthora idaei]|nr:hypothetical protein PI126_g6063 [Phytophthora idaei]KAG3236516.1 hypothetical protein PI124_g18488 [Phytophthora idaei]